MSDGDQVLPTTNVPNGYTTPPATPSIGATVDMGPTQGAVQRQFSLAGASSSDVVDINDSQTGAPGSWTQVARLSGGDRVVLTEVARYLRTIRQAGTEAVTCQVGDLVAPGSASPGSYWDVGGNATGPLTGGTEDGSGVAIGAGLAGGVIPTPAAGTFAVNAQTAISLALAGVNQFLAGAGGVQLGNSGPGGIALGAGVAPTNTNNTITMAAASAVVVGVGEAAPTPASGTFAVNAAVEYIFALAGINQIVAGSGGIGIGNSGAGGIAIGAGITPSTIPNTLTLDAFTNVFIGTTGATGVQVGNYTTTTNTALEALSLISILNSTTGGGQINMGSQGAVYPTLANSIQLRTHGNGSVQAIADGSGAARLQGGSGGAQVDAVGGPALFGAGTATASTLGNASGLSTIQGSNIVLGNASASLGGGVGVIFIPNDTTDPTANPIGGGLMFVVGGALKWRGSAGTVTTIAPA